MEEPYFGTDSVQQVTLKTFDSTFFLKTNVTLIIKVNSNDDGRFDKPNPKVRFIVQQSTSP